MSGQTVLKPSKEQLEQVDKILDEYESKTLGLPEFQKPGEDSELQQYVSMDRKALEAMSVDDCNAAAYRIAQFSFHIQRSQNREKARIGWATSKLKLYIADKVGQYKAYSYEERMFACIKNDEYATSLHMIQKYAQQRSDRLDFIATSLKTLSDLIKNIAYNKHRNLKDE